MLAVALLIAGAGFAAWLAAPSYPRDLVGAGLAPLLSALAQLAIAGAAIARLPGAWLFAIAALVVQAFALGVLAIIVIAMVALPAETGSPGPAFNPIALGAIVASSVGLAWVYALGFRSSLELRREASKAVGEEPSSTATTTY